MGRKCLVRPVNSTCDRCKYDHKKMGTRPVCKTCKDVKEAELIEVVLSPAAAKVAFDDEHEIKSVELYRVFNVED